MAQLLAGRGSFTASADGFDNQIQALNAQIAALQQQLASTRSMATEAVQAADAAQQSLAATQTQLATGEEQLNSANLRLSQTQTAMGLVSRHLASDKQMLAADMVDEFEAQDNDSAIDAVLGANGLTGAITALIGVRRFTTTTQQLTQNVTDEEHGLAQLRATQQAEQLTATTDVTGLQRLLAQEHVEEASYQAQASALTGQGGAIVAQIGSLQSQVNQLREEQAAAQAAASAGGVIILGGLAPFALGSQTDLFPWGECTWYVASLRPVTWWGDAWQWAGEAAAQGAPEGMTPRVGAIVVWGRGNGYSSDAGHVAYVAAVQSPTSFTVNEGNFISLGLVDQRQVGTLQDVEAFIY